VYSELLGVKYIIADAHLSTLSAPALVSLQQGCTQARILIRPHIPETAI
jgi:hypothetical protein